MDDADSLVKHANNFNIARFLTNGFPHPYTQEDAYNFLSVVSNTSPTTIMAIEVNDEAVGSIGLTPQTDIHCKNAELGYFISEDYWGRGIMTQAIKQMVDYGFSTFGVTRIFARPFGTNKASQRVLEKAGFELEARFKNAIYKYDEFMDELIYGITPERFELYR